MALHKMAQKLRRRRFDEGSLTLDNAKLSFRLDGDGYPESASLVDRQPANELVEEMMLLANRRVATRIAKEYPDGKALLRCFQSFH